MKANKHVMECIHQVIEMRVDGYNSRQISEKVGKSKSFIDRMIRNLPKLIAHLA